MTQRRRRAVLVVPLQDVEEARELQPRGGEVVGVGIGEVRVDSFHDRVAALGGPLQQAVGVVVVHADALHAGVDLQMDPGGDAQVAGGRVDLPQLVDGGRRQREAVAEEQRDLVAEDAAHHQDGQRDAGLTQRHRLLEKGDAQPARALRDQVAGDLDQAVAVGVGLDDRHDGGRRDGRLDRPEILRQARQAHLDDRRPHDRRVAGAGGGHTHAVISSCSAARARATGTPPGAPGGSRPPT